MAANDWLLQRLADIVGSPVERPHVIETTVLGAAMLAALGADICDGTDGLVERWRCEKRFEPRLDDTERARHYTRWQDAVARTRSRHG